MAINVSILRQPLYGSVVWNGFSFIYTPNVGFSGSDSFVFSEISDGIQRVYTKYVNSSNTPPIPLTVSLSAFPYILTEIDVNSVVVDYTNPFNVLKFVDVESSLNNKVYTDGDRLYYTSNTPNTLDIITYTATDKQFTVTGRISVNALSASEGASYNYNPLEKLYQIKNITTSYEQNSSGWTGSYAVYVQYGSVWDNIDLTQYEGFANQVIEGYSNWTSIYDYRNIYYSLYTNLSTNSGRWIEDTISGNYNYSIINPKSLLWNDVYNILNSSSGNWNNSISTFNKLSAGLYYTSPFYSSVYTTVASSSSSIWNPTDLNSWSSNYLNVLRSTYNYTSANSAKWIAPVSGYQSLSAGMSNVVDNIKSTSNSVIANSSILWGNSYLNDFSAEYYNKWTIGNNELSSNELKFNYFSILINSISSGVDITNNNSNLLFTNVSTNSSSIWEYATNENLISSNSANWNNLFLILTANSSSWAGNNDIATIINDFTPIFNFSYNSVSSNSATLWSGLDSNLNLLLSNSANLSLLYSIITTNSSNWYYSSDLPNIINNDTPKFDSVYNSVSSNSATLWSGLDNNSNLIISNSANLETIYNILTANSSNWSYPSDLPNIIASISGRFSNVYNNVLSNSGTIWLENYQTLLSSNSSIWNDSYNVTRNYSGTWTSGNTLSSTILNDQIKFDSTYNTLTSNSGSNWIGETIYQSISDNIFKYQQLADFLYNGEIDYKWTSLISKYNIIFNSFDAKYPDLESYRSTVETGSSFWDTSYVDAILSGLSADLKSNYNILSAYSGTWIFAEPQILKNTLSYVQANSAILQDQYLSLTDSLPSWDNSLNISNISQLSSQYLSGNATNTISSRNLYIHGNLLVAQNLSALGSKTSINTSNYSLTAFEVINDSNTNCFIITKGNSLTNIVTFSSVSTGPVLWVKSNNTVGINTTSPNQALTVVGDISASGTITTYLNTQVSLIQSNSARYELAYTFLNNNSSSLTEFNNSKVYYDNMTNYQNISSTNINNLFNRIPNYDLMYYTISSNYNISDNVNTFVTYSTANINIDTTLRTLTGKYQNGYNTLTSVCATQVTSLNYLFSYNKVVSSDKVKIIIPYNLKIDSWSVFSDQPTTLSIEVLSGYTQNKTSYTNSITNNKPITASNATKASANQLDALGWTTVINTGGTNSSFIQFNLTKNDSSSAVMVNLKAYKI